MWKLNLKIIDVNKNMRENNSPPKLRKIYCNECNNRNDFYILPITSCVIGIFTTISVAYILKLFNYCE